MNTFGENSEAGNTIEILFKQNHGDLCRRAYTFVRDQDTAKDIVQEVFLKLWKNRDDIEWSESLRSYLYKATTHASLNYLKSHKRKQEIHTQIHLSSRLSTDETSETIHLNEIQHKVQQAIDYLPPKCKVIYLLSRQEGLRYHQIAEQLDISVKTVENQMGIALEKLRHTLRPFLTKEFLLSLIIVALSLATHFMY